MFLISRGRGAPQATHKAQTDYSDLIALFHEIDEKQKQLLSLHDLAHALGTNERLARICHAENVGPIAASAIASKLFASMDADDNGYITVEEFVRGCARLDGRPEPPHEKHFVPLDGALVDALASGVHTAVHEATTVAGGVTGVFNDATAQMRRKLFPANSGSSKREGRAESKLLALKQVLRAEVVDSTEEKLAKAKGDDAALAALYYSQLVHVIDQVRRLAATDGDDGSEDETSLQVEVLQLRRELAETKLRLAEAMSQSFEDRKSLADLRAAPKSGRLW
ncbi:hypothetical protein AB1Y20_013253 [Prymnesium parvum]|uniref:EF-hand domain-containing protein n=1 Tax=Prymnesium parvum TaxID=97485 RepID=A0AB34IMN7_PRYPA